MLDYKSIPKSESDLLLNEWGYDLLEEYFVLINEADFPSNNFIFDVATGTGRAVSILSRMKSNVITGDFSFDLKLESERRISNEHLGKVSFIKLNLEHLPFQNNFVENIVCMNTLHELDNPFLCLNEIIRIHSGKGKLLIGDFNSEGYDVMDKLHTERYGKLHPRGKISSEELRTILTVNYSEIKEINTKLNRVFIASGKGNEK